MTCNLTHCPTCGDHLNGLGRYCFRCEAYTDDMIGATTDTTPASRPDPVRDTRTEAVTIVLPWNLLASDNLRKRYRGDGDGAWAEYKACRDGAHTEAMKQVRHRPAFSDGDVAVSIDFRLPDRRRRDPNNLTKMICDALTGVAYGDDAQVASMSWVRVGVDAKHAGATITVQRRTP